MESVRKSSWTEFRDLTIAKELLFQYEENSKFYDIYAICTGVVYHYRLKKSPPSSDLTDWEDNYKATANRPVPQKRSTFSVGEYRFRGERVVGTCAAGATATVDLTLTELRLLSGGEVVVSGSTIFDWVKFQVVHPNGTTVLDEYVGSWGVNPTTGCANISMEYAGEVLDTWKLRLIYNADAAGGERKFVVNYLLHKPT